MTLETVLRDVFEQGAERRIADPAEERELIARAQLGEEAATVALIYAYAPALRRAAREHADTLGAEDARSSAIEGLLVAVAEWDADKVGREPRLAGNVARTLARTLGSQAGREANLAIPTRSLQRFYAVLRAAGGDVQLGEKLAAEHELRPSSFRMIAEAVFADSLEELTATDTESGPSVEGEARPLWSTSDGFSEVEDRIVSELALDALDDRERAVIVASFGLLGGEPMSDSEVAEELGMTKPTVQRVRTAALATMRQATGASR